MHKPRTLPGLHLHSDASQIRWLDSALPIRAAREEEKSPGEVAGAAMMLTNFDGCLLAGVGAVDRVAHVGERPVKGWADNV